MAETVTFLQLAPEFGGTRFGPFVGYEIRVGSDPNRNDITVPESLGVAPEHVKILRQPDDTFILAPVERTATLFYWRAGATRPTQLNAPRAVQDGDGFSLVTAEGPRFYILLENDKKRALEKAKESEGPGAAGLGKNLNSRGIMAEIKRVGLAKALTSKMGNGLMKVWTFIKTGQFLSPMYIIMGMTMLSGYLFAGGSTCAAVNFRSKNTTLKNDLAECQATASLSKGTDGEYLTGQEIVERILGDDEWSETLSGDPDLENAFKKGLRRVFESPEDYQDVYRPNSDFAQFKKAIDGSSMPEPVSRVLAYAAAKPTFNREWDVVENSNGDEVCGRGPLRMTFAQGYQLELRDVQPDAFVGRTRLDTVELEERIRATADAVNADVRIAGNIDQDNAGKSGLDSCAFVMDDDDRVQVSTLVRTLNREIGVNAKKLPKESEPFWIAARLVKFYAADFERGYGDLDFGQRRKSPTLVLDDVTQNRRDYAISKAGEVIARAVAMPCIAHFDEKLRTAPPEYLGELPHVADCATIQAYVTFGLY